MIAMSNDTFRPRTHSEASLGDTLALAGGIIVLAISMLALLAHWMS